MNSRVPREPAINQGTEPFRCWKRKIWAAGEFRTAEAEATESVLLLLHPGPLQVRAPFRPLDSYLCEHTRGPRILLNTLSKHNYGLELVLKIR